MSSNPICRPSARALLVAGASFAAMIAIPAAAQSTRDQPTPPAGDAKASSDQNPEIIVTAQFRQQRLQDTPLAITAVDSKMIEARGNTTLADVVKSAPNVVITPQTQAFGPTIAVTIRGLGQGDLDPAYEPGVGIYIDDVYYPRLTGANLDLMDVERVEILRGPQGTLTGRNSEGGAVKFYSRKPDGTGGGYLEGTYGSRDLIKLRGAADFTLADGLFGRLSGTYTHQRGYVAIKNFACDQPSGGVPLPQQGSSCTTGWTGGQGNQAIRGILRYAPSDAVDIMISSDYTHEEHGGAAEVLLYANNANPNVATASGVPLDSRFLCGKWCNYDTYTSDPLPNFNGYFITDPTAGPTLVPWDVYNPLSQIPGNPAGAFVVPGAFGPGGVLPGVTGSPTTLYDGWGVSANARFKLSDNVNFTSITGYRQWKSTFTADGDLSPANTGLGLNELHDKFFSQELRLNANFGDMVEATLGGYYSTEKSLYWTLQDIRYAPIPLQFVGDDPINTNSKAVYGTVIIKPVAGLTFTGGLRYTKEHKDYTFHRYAVDGVTVSPFLGAINGQVATFDGNRTDYRASLDYRFSPQFMIYGTVSTGFKGGGVSPRPFNPLQVLSFKPETVTTYEAGIKTDLFDRRLRFNATAFYNVFKNAQLTLLSCDANQGGNPCALTVNAGNAHQKGLEFELDATPIDGLSIDASASYLKYDYTCVIPAVVISGGDSTTCSSDPAVLSQLSSPADGWKWTLGAQYKIEMGSAGALTPRVDVSRTDKILSNAIAAPVAGSPSALYGQVPGYTLANASLMWQNAGGDLSATLAVTNLFDKYYFVNKFDFSNFAGAGTISGLPGRPREWSITVKKKF